MKVLWFSLSPCGSMRRTNSTKFTQTWMTTLEDGIKGQKDIDLSVAYYCNASSYESPFDYEGVHYYPIINRDGGLLDKIKERFESIESQDSVLIKRALEVVNKVKPDIIHVHGTESNFGLLVDHVKDIPIVISLQGIISPIVERYYAGIPKNVVKSCDTIGDYVHQINETKIFDSYKYAAHREQRILHGAKYVLGRTEWDHQIVSMIAPQAKYYVVNEIIREEFLNNSWGKSFLGNPFCIVSTLSNGIYKGYELILKSAEILKQNAPFDFEWKVIGCDESYKYVKASIKMTGLKPSDVNVRFWGRKMADEMVQLMKDADLYVQTSHIENSPNALCEALCLGMPCLASNVGGTATMMLDGTVGELYPAGDPYALSSRIIKLHQDYNRYVEIARSARDISIKRNSSESVVERLTQVYQDILNCK